MSYRRQANTKKYKKNWDKISNGMETELDSEPEYEKKYLKTKMKFYGGKVKAGFHGKKIPKEGSHYVCQSIIVFDSVCKIKCKL